MISGARRQSRSRSHQFARGQPPHSIYIRKQNDLISENVWIVIGFYWTLYIHRCDCRLGVLYVQYGLSMRTFPSALSFLIAFWAFGQNRRKQTKKYCSGLVQNVVFIRLYLCERNVYALGKVHWYRSFNSEVITCGDDVRSRRHKNDQMKIYERILINIEARREFCNACVAYHCIICRCCAQSNRCNLWQFDNFAAIVACVKYINRGGRKRCLFGESLLVLIEGCLRKIRTKPIQSFTCLTIYHVIKSRLPESPFSIISTDSLSFLL